MAMTRESITYSFHFLRNDVPIVSFHEHHWALGQKTWQAGQELGIEQRGRVGKSGLSGEGSGPTMR